MDDFIKGLFKGIIPPSIPWGLIVSSAIFRIVDFLNIKNFEWVFFLSIVAIFTVSAIMFSLFGLLYALDYDMFQRWTKNATISLTITAFIIIAINLML